MTSSWGSGHLHLDSVTNIASGFVVFIDNCRTVELGVDGVALPFIESCISIQASGVSQHATIPMKIIPPIIQQTRPTPPDRSDGLHPPHNPWVEGSVPTGPTRGMLYNWCRSG
jgi:hypothetical protein